MTAKERKPVAPFYAVAALWLLSGAFLPLYTAKGCLLLAAASVIVFFLVNKFCQRAGTVAGAAGETESAPVSAGNEELEKMLKNGKLALSEMKRLDENIADPGVSADIARLSQVSEEIFQAVREDPAKLPQIRKFMDYYLPTTLKLLNAYDRMSATGVSGENISGTLNKVEDMMKTVVKAFERQLDSLYGAEALDISADIKVMETLLAREGLSGSRSGGADIKLEL